MAEPFKNNIHPELIESMSVQFARHFPGFERERFVSIACDQIEQRELKDRCMQIVVAMEATLPEDFEVAARGIGASLGPPLDAEVNGGEVEGITGWAVMALQEYVGRNGLDHLEVSLDLLKAMTSRLTSEFGIRPFLDAFPLQTLRILQRWVKDPSPHVRRLVSEGARPRLPWGLQLKRFIADPSPMLPFLESLKDDPSEYVRRSVANHLNDIAKDHPELVCRIAERWWVDADIQRQRLIRHALRTLVKKGNARALAVLGFHPAKIEMTAIRVEPNPVSMGQKLRFETTIQSIAAVSQRLVIDYAIHYVKANGERRAKVFKGTTCELEPGGVVSFQRSHSFAPVTTRTYYSGEHLLEILVNGKSEGCQSFALIEAAD